MAVAEELSFQRGADALFVSQSLLSKQIRQLESEVRAQLFDRQRRTVSLTVAGHALLPHAREVLARWDRAQRSVGDAVASEQAVLTVGLSTSAGRGLLQQARERFEERRPRWRLEFRQVDWEDAAAGCGEGIA